MWVNKKADIGKDECQQYPGWSRDQLLHTNQLCKQVIYQKDEEALKLQPIACKKLVGRKLLLYVISMLLTNSTNTIKT